MNQEELVSYNSDVKKTYSLSEAAYNFGYSVRRKHSDFIENNLSWLLDSESTPLNRLNSSSGEIRILSLGCGSGDSDIIMLDHLAEKGLKADYTGIDFNQFSVHEFSDRIRCNPNLMRHNISVLCDSIGPKTLLGRAYDLIIIGHLLYSIEDPHGIIDMALSHLDENGIAIISHMSDEGVPKIRGRIEHLLPARKFLMSEGIIAYLHSLKIDPVCHNISCKLYLDPLRDYPSMDSLLLLSFCCSCDLARYPKGIQDRVYKEFIASRVNEDNYISEKLSIIEIRRKPS